MRIATSERLPGPVVSDSGPLITLATIGELCLLRELFGQITISPAVSDEVVVRGQGQPGASEAGSAGWIRTERVSDHLAVRLLRESLGAGESESIVLAQELGAGYLLLDDALARRRARLIGLPVAGTLGVLLIAKEAGIISAVRPLVVALGNTEFRISEHVANRVLARGGEA